VTALALGPNWPDDFSAIATAGYYVALRIGFAFPVDERNEFPKSWIDYYTQNGLMLFDPSVRWVYENTGAIRWSDLSTADPKGVLESAQSYGLKFGVVICCSDDDDGGQRTYGTFARPDREVSNEEIAVLSKNLTILHRSLNPPTNLTQAELEALMLVKDGLRLKEIAYQLGVSEGAIKQRLNGAKKKLDARTNTQAASKAVEFRLI